MMKAVVAVLLSVKFQHEPQERESYPSTANAPPILGNVGRSPKVLNPLAIIPFLPPEHATTVIGVLGLSNTGSYLTTIEDAEAKRAVRGMMNEMSFIMEFLDRIVSVYSKLGTALLGNVAVWILNLLYHVAKVHVRECLATLRYCETSEEGNLIDVLGDWSSNDYNKGLLILNAGATLAQDDSSPHITTSALKRQASTGFVHAVTHPSLKGRLE